MGSKTKGSRTERELLYLLYNNKFMITRTAGSGTIPIPSPDLLASNGKKIYAIECKSTKKKTKYLNKQQLQELRLFAKRFGAIPLLAIKFNHAGWFFFNLNKLKKLVISLEFAKEKGLQLKDIIQ